ncbi:hypothetical protein IW261DRAFT_1434141 [Armillaria novae-zelandiae]|uniref:Secreted protein n=1 Tax=Armillaria novae-zelandiae TaxID=153914 RepID=A0AA39PX91_9AGAR|nr:hypothetical protein IW261DRAFT_1434141 [Armillaria novae-zelandiae]
MHANLLYTFCLSVTTLVSEMNPLHICDVERKTFHTRLLRGARTWVRIPSEGINETVRSNRVEMVDRYHNRSDVNEEPLTPIRKLSRNQPKGGNYPSVRRQNKFRKSHAYINRPILERQDDQNGASDQKPDKE